MLDTGAGFTLLSKKWCTVHNVTISEAQDMPVAKTATGSVINMAGVVPTLTIRLS